jgi:hypothetical protein
MAHTPGPWSVQASEKAFCWEINHVPDRGLWSAVAEVGANALGSRKVAAQEAEGNARLAAAAPELLDAARIALAMMGGDDDGPDDDDMFDVWQKVRAAIAKAEGRD